jgi:hypothetical protein
LDKIDVTSEQWDSGGRGLLPEETTSPFNITSYWGPNGCTNIFKVLIKKKFQVKCSVFNSFGNYFPWTPFVQETELGAKDTMIVLHWELIFQGKIYTKGEI